MSTKAVLPRRAAAAERTLAVEYQWSPPLLTITHHFQPQLETFLKHLFFSFLVLTGSAVAHAQDCSVNPGACQPKPIPSECPAGKHWVTTGTGIAHCVTNDPVCTGGTVVHDAIGEPQYCQTSEDRTASCPAGYSGYKDQTRTVKTALDGTKSYGSWTTTYNGCEKDPEPTPAPSAGTGDQGGNTGTSNPATPSTGTGSGSTNPSTGSGDPSPATPPTGTGTTPVLGDPPTGGGSTMTCSNGATNYPTCTLPVTYTCKIIKEYTYLTACGGPNDSQRYIWEAFRVCNGSDGSLTKTSMGEPQDGVRGCGAGGSHVDR